MRFRDRPLFVLAEFAIRDVERPGENVVGLICGEVTVMQFETFQMIFCAKWLIEQFLREYREKQEGVRVESNVQKCSRCKIQL